MTETNLLSALKEAHEKGYPHDFVFDENGNLLSDKGEVINPQIIEFVPCESCGATLYLLAYENIKGTIVHQWETVTN